MFGGRRHAACTTAAYGLAGLMMWWSAGAIAQGQLINIAEPPFEYAATEPDDAISRLQAKLESGRAKLSFDATRGYLESTLKELNVPVSSQVLVFSKTSLQKAKISPATPRAIYFNDDVYVAWCLDGDLIELSAADSLLGTNYYTLPQHTKAPARFERDVNSCTFCHMTQKYHQGAPGHLVRSATTDAGGAPDNIVNRLIDHTTPIADRWGGWYVSGRYNGQPHLGNRPGESQPSGAADTNDLTFSVDLDAYLTPHSDLIALMVLEHQVEGHNRIARAGMFTRAALYTDALANPNAGDEPAKLSAAAKKRIESVCEPLVEYLLYSGEAPLNGPTTGTSGFVKEFAERGPKTTNGRSLREFDLKDRLFKHPLSYLVYTESFAQLPAEALDYVHRRLHEVLTGQDQSEKFAHLTAEDRAATLQIARETLPNLPAYWKE